jgi:peptidoglycan/LPS O-acetylase OafA/YrhL
MSGTSRSRTLSGMSRGMELSRDLPSLTSLRAAAALLVFVFHIDRWGVLNVPLGGVGDTGVAFFFVLSGFLLTWGYVGRVDARRFYVRRFARIWPSHLVMWVVALLVPIVAFAPTWPTALVNLPLLQGWVPVDRYVFGVNGVTWSLSCEVAFYAAFPLALAFLARRSIRAAWTASAVAFAVTGAYAVAVSVLDVPHWMELVGFANPVIRFPEFLLGIAAALAVRSGWRLSWTAAAVVTVPCLIGFALVHDRPARDVWLAPLFLLMIVLAATRDCRGRTWLAAGPLVYAGKVSFAFYLVHELVIENLRHYLGTGVATVAAALLLSAAAAVALHHAVELPAQARLVRALDSAKRTTPSDPVER